MTTAVCSALWETIRPWLQDDSIRLEFNVKLEKKEKKLFKQMSSSTVIFVQIFDKMKRKQLRFCFIVEEYDCLPVGSDDYNSIVIIIS